MLNTIRNLAKSWVAGILFVILILSFAVWGIGDIFRGSSRTDVAEIGKRHLSDKEFLTEFNRLVEAYIQQSGGSFDRIQARRMGLDVRVLYDMVQRTMMDERARMLGLATSDREISRLVHDNPEFADVGGAFSKQTYLELLQKNGFTAEDYESRLRSDLTRQQLLRAVTGGITVPKEMAEEIYGFQHEQRELDYLVVTSNMVPPPADPTPEEAKAYYDAHRDDYTAPEYRTFTIVRFEPELFAPRVTVDEKDIKAAYEFDKDKYGVPERRTVQILTFITEQEGRDAYKSLESGATFESLAAAKGMSLADIERKHVTRKEILDTKVAEVAFQLPKDEISEPINGTLGWAVARVTEIEPGQIKPLEEVHDQIRDELAVEASKEALYDAFPPFEEAIDGGASLEEAAKTAGLPSEKKGPVDSEGKGPDGKTVAGLPDPAHLNKALFSTKSGAQSDFAESGTDGYFILRVDSVIPSRIKEYDEVNSEVVNTLKKERLRAAIRALADSIVERADKGESFEDLAKENGKSVLSQGPVKRDSENEVFSADMMTKIFARPVGEFVSDAAHFGDSYVVAVTREIIPADPAAKPDEINQLNLALTKSMDSDFIAEYLGALEKKLGVKIHQDTLDQILGAVPEEG